MSLTIFYLKHSDLYFNLWNANVKKKKTSCHVYAWHQHSISRIFGHLQTVQIHKKLSCVCTYNLSTFEGISNFSSQYVSSLLVDGTCLISLNTNHGINILWIRCFILITYMLPWSYKKFIYGRRLTHHHLTSENNLKTRI